MSEKIAVLTTGWRATRRNNWFPETARQFEKAGYEVIIPEMPRKGIPSQETSLRMLTEGIGERDNIILVGHSCHARTTLHYAEANSNVRALIVVAGYLETIPMEMEDPAVEDWKQFYSRLPDYEAIMKNVPHLLGLYSKDDTKMPYNQAAKFVKKLNGTVYTFPDQGHFEDTTLPVNIPAYLKSIGL